MSCGNQASTLPRFERSPPANFPTLHGNQKRKKERRKRSNLHRPCTIKRRTTKGQKRSFPPVSKAGNYQVREHPQNTRFSEGFPATLTVREYHKKSVYFSLKLSPLRRISNSLLLRGVTPTRRRKKRCPGRCASVYEQIGIEDSTALIETV